MRPNKQKFEMRQILSEKRLKLPDSRADTLRKYPTIIWLTGLSGSGKTSIANALEAMLTADGLHSVVLDGDTLRIGLNSDLGFTAADRTENARRTAEVARMMAKAGLITIVALISPMRADRALARKIAGEVRFFEVFIDASLAQCEARDVKGLYALARAGSIKQFTGISAPYEPPMDPDLILRTADWTVSDSAMHLKTEVLRPTSLQ
jgi:adenylylsulfate kinase